MIEISNVVTPSYEELQFAIQGMRNPMNSWARSDLGGDKDAELMLKLAKAGSEHRKYMRMMPIYARITAPLYWWKEFDTYKIGTVSNSTSTMHKITSKSFDISDFSTDHLNESSIATLKTVIAALEVNRNRYLEEGDPEEKKNDWWQIIQLLPSSYNQTRNISMNYEVLTDIYRQRRGHKLDEWNKFCDWVETLPYSAMIVELYKHG